MEINTIGKAFNTAIDFSITIDKEYPGSGIEFLRLWREGSWSEIKKEFPEFDLDSVQAFLVR